MNAYNLIPFNSSVGLSDSTCLVIYEVNIYGFNSRKIKKPDENKYKFRVNVYDSSYKSDYSRIEITKEFFTFKLRVDPRIFDKLVHLHISKSLVDNITVIEVNQRNSFLKRPIVDYRLFF
jgi:hypothetical protein